MAVDIHHVDLGMQRVSSSEHEDVITHITHSFAEFGGERFEAYSESPQKNEAAIRDAIATYCEKTADELRRVNVATSHSEKV